MLQCFNFLDWNGLRFKLTWTTKLFHGQANQVLWLPKEQLDTKVNFEPCNLTLILRIILTSINKLITFYKTETMQILLINYKTQ